MRFVEVIPVSSKDDIDFNLLKTYLIKKKVFCLRGLNLSEEEQLLFTKKLGDVMQWTPNTSNDFNHKYIENHASNQKLEDSKIGEVFLAWHLEHIDYDNYSPLVAGVWNMQIFTCSPDAGNTYFMDSREVYRSLFSEEEKEFLEKCESSWEEIYHSSGPVKNVAKVVMPHWITGEKQIRVELIVSADLESFDGRRPTEDEKEKFTELYKRFKSEVWNNEELRIVHRWQQGDILIPDLYSLAHAVTGGFDPSERKFTGFWCYINYPENLEEASVHPSWRSYGNN